MSHLLSFEHCSPLVKLSGEWIGVGNGERGAGSGRAYKKAVG